MGKWREFRILGARQFPQNHVREELFRGIAEGLEDTVEAGEGLQRRSAMAVDVVGCVEACVGAAGGGSCGWWKFWMMDDSWGGLISL